MTATRAELTEADLPFLVQAASELGLEQRLNADGSPRTTFRWYGVWVGDYHAEDAAYRRGVPVEDYGKADLVFGLKDDDAAYELGLRKSEGGYQLLYDFYGHGQRLRAAIGPGARTLLEAYGRLKAEAKLRQCGFQVLGVGRHAKTGHLQIKARPDPLRAGLARGF